MEQHARKVVKSELKTKPELKTCPFCGTSMEILTDKYPNGDMNIRPYGWHDENCPLDSVLWCFDVEDGGWTEEKVAEAWNWRADEL